jgi:hypothetical protein
LPNYASGYHRVAGGADLFGSVAAGPGARDRMHYHPLMADDEPGDRQYEPAIKADPLGWMMSGSPVSTAA